jgi:hypothetical protein
VFSTPREGDTYLGIYPGYVRISDVATETITLPASCQASALWAAETGEVFVASSTKVCRRAGNTVDEWDLPGVDALWGRAPNDIYAAGAGMQHFDGQAWSAVATGADAPFTGIHGRGAKIAATTASGVAIFDGAWSYVAAPGANTERPWISASGIVYVYSGDRVYRRVGATWSAMPMTPEAISGYWGIGERLYALAGDNVSALVDSTWIELQTPPTFTGFAAFGGGDDHLLAIEGYNVLHESRGFSWTAFEPTFTSAIWAFGPTNVVALSAGSSRRFNGTAWQAHPSPGVFIASVWGYGTNRLIGVGSNRALHFDGNAWSTTNVGGELKAVFGESPSRVFAVGYATPTQGMIWHYNGATWTPAFPVTTGQPTSFAIWGSTARGSYAVLFDKLFHLPPGAAPTQWIEIPTPEPTPASVFGDDNEIVVGFESRRVHRLAGTTWTQLPTRLPAPAVSLTGSSGDVFGVGGNHLYHYDGVTFDRVRIDPALAADGAQVVFAGNGIVAVGNNAGVQLMVRP